jgi:hypothetical protein
MALPRSDENFPPPLDIFRKTPRWTVVDRLHPKLHWDFYCYLSIPKSSKTVRLGLQLFKFGNIHAAVGKEKAPVELCKAGILVSRPFCRVLDDPSDRCNSREVAGARFPEVATVADEEVTFFFFFFFVVFFCFLV